MRFKVVPEPRTLEFVADAQGAVPLVPETEDDCCARLLDRLDLVSRDEAREWLTFLRALGLVETGERGFHRRRVEPRRDDLTRAFRERVHGAEAVLDALAADGPLDPEGVYERVADTFPRWERDRHADPEEVWRERVRRLVEWAVVFGLAEREDGRYRRVDG